ncbi:hypothetical protein [Microbacterium sp.]|uniref:hypothetical protein n=1 Tax=Microbacterium sp. TaxID=51671 RepID=UPI00334260DB
MFDRIPRQARRTAGLIAAASLLLAGLIVGQAERAGADQTAPHARAVLGATPTYDGVVSAWPGDRDKDPSHAATSKDGTACWTMSQDPLNRYLYVDVATAAKPSGSKYANVRIGYYDAAATSMRIEYDGTASRFQASPSVALDGTGTWRTTTIQLDAIRFLNGANNADFRINVNPVNGAVPPVCFSELSVTFSNVPRLSLTNPSLLLTTDAAHLDFGTLASNVAYTLTASDGTPLRSGALPVGASGTASLDVSDLGPGYYGIAFSGDVLGETVTRTSSFGIITPTPAGALDPSSFFGISTHFGHYGASEDALLQSLATIGYGHVRGDLNWELIEKSAGVYDFAGYAFDKKSAQAKSLGMTPMGVVAYRNPLYDGGVTPHTSDGLAAFGRFAAASAAKYAPGIRDFNVYNEYNGTGFNTSSCQSATCYVEMLKAVYGPMHAANPDVNVMGPITSGINAAWNDEFFAQGGLAYVDTFATNVYGYALHGQNTPPEDTLLTSALPDLVARVDQEAGARDVPVWITENGWPTHAIGSTLDEQAEDLVRASVLVMAAGVDVYTWYSAMDDGTDPNEREHNFGIFQRPDEAALGIVPKPAAVSSAVLIRQVGGKTLQPREDLGAAGIYSYPYTGQGKTTRVMWAPKTPAAVLVKGNGPVTVVDERGASTTFTPPASGTYIDLDSEPLYLQGAVTSVTAGSGAPQLTVGERSVASEPVSAEVTMKRSALHGPHRGLTTEAEGAEGAGFSVRAGVLRSTITLPATSALGDRTARVSVMDTAGGGGAKPLALLRGRTTTVEPFAISASPRIAETAGVRQNAVDVTVTNNAPAAVAPQRLDYLIGGRAGVLDDLGSIAGGASKVYRLDAGDPTPFAPQQFRLTLRAADRSVAAAGSVTFSPIVREGAGNATPIDLDALGGWVGTGGQRTGPADVGGTLSVTHDDLGLVLDAKVVDDVHRGARDATMLWQTDSIQFAVYDRSPWLSGGQHVEIGAALLDGGPAVRTFLAPKGQQPGETPGAEVSIERDETTRVTHYVVRLPWASLGFATAPTEPFAMSFLVNDDDSGKAGDARDGFLQWGSGIATTPKDPGLFRDAQLVG